MTEDAPAPVTNLIEVSLDSVPEIQLDKEFVLAMQHEILDLVRVRYGSDATLACSVRLFSLKQVGKTTHYSEMDLS